MGQGTETIATKIKIPNINISSDEDISGDNSLSIIYESAEWQETSVSSEAEIVSPTQLIAEQLATKKKRIENPIWKFGNLKKNKTEIDFTTAPDQETFENHLKDFTNGPSSFYYLFPVDILNDIVCQSILYSAQERLKNQSVLGLMTLRNSLLVLYICQ